MHHQSPQSDSQNLSSQERAALRQVRSRRWQTLFAGAGALALTLFAVGCPEPADLADVPAGPGPGGGSGPVGGSGPQGGSGGGGPVVCETACIDKLFTTDPLTCKLCHSNDIALGGLNLSTGYTARLKDQPAKHLDGMDPEMPLPASAGCMPASLINTANPGESWLWKKVNKLQGMCGDKMPQTSEIKAADLACVKTYIECVAQKPITAGGGGSGSGGSASGGSASGGSASGGSASGGSASGGGSGGKGGGGGTGGT